MEPVTLSALAAWAAMISAAAAAVTVIFTFKAILQATRTQELATVDRVFNSIAELEEKLYDAVASGHGQTVLPTWRGLFLNRLEYFSFLVNQNYLRDPTLASFFAEAVVRWYEDVFEKLADQAEKTDPKIYPELKALYLKLKSKSGVETITSN